ncbi:MAG: dihydrodipicolinate synthase family protein [Tissierellia bacterium]|nr:dihydrodipicolinate synthase family protein [Tissierellia bacterium]
MSSFDICDIKGVIPAMITPFDEKEELDKEKVQKLVEHLIEKNVNGLYLGGSTGEGFLMDHEERKLLVEYVIEQVRGRIPVIVHVGSISTKLSIDLAKHAYEKGADAISSVPPFYWRFDNESIFQYYKDISESTPLPMIIYNVPLAGLMGIDMIYKLAEIENVKGIKYTATNHFEINLIKDRLGKDFMLYSGSDEMAVSGLLHGADGLIGSFYSMIPDIFENIYAAMQEERLKEASLNQQVSVDIIMASLKYDYYAAIKLALSWMGIDAGRVRRPFKELSKDQEEEFRKDLLRIKDKYKDFECDLFKAL